MLRPSYCPACFARLTAQTLVCPGCQTDIAQWDHDHPYIERLIQALKHPQPSVRMQAIISLGKQNDVRGALPLAECALAHPRDVVQGCEILRSVRQLPAGPETTRALSLLAQHPAQSVREAVTGHGTHLRCFQLTPQNALELVPTATPTAAWLHDERKRWLDIETQALPALPGVLAPFELPAPIVHYCMERISVTRVEADDRLVFVNLPLPAAAARPQEASLTVVCLPTTLVTIHTQPFPSLAKLPAKLMHQRHRAALTLSALLLHILAQCIEEDVHDYLALRETTTQLTAQLDQTPDAVEGKTILDLKRQVNHLVHTCENQLFATMTLATIDSPAFSVRHLSKSADSVVKGVRHCQRGVTRLEAQVQDLQQHYVLMVQQATNHRLRILTIMSAVFMPLTLITGIYGMNFAHMPELASPAAYPIVLGVMLVIAFLLLGFFYRNGWFE